MAERAWPGDRAAEVVRELATHLIIDGGNDEEAIQLVQAVGSRGDVIPTEREYRGLIKSVLSWKEPEIDEAVERVYQAPSCPITRAYCHVHGQVHGAEAEELRRWIENLLFEATASCAPDDWPAALQKLLDRVDARDSLAFLEAGDKAPSTTAPEPVVRIEITPDDDGDEFVLLSEARTALKTMIHGGLKTTERQFCGGVIRITREGFDG